MQCSQCQHENPDSSRFCNSCGAKLDIPCSACEHVNLPGSRFCNACGHNLAAANPSSIQPEKQPVTEAERSPTEPFVPEAERRQLTVMFCDLVESTALSGRLDPEDLREVIRAYQTACTEVIQRYDGHVAQLLGDGLLVYFGYPQAHEDDAQRAVHTGLGMLGAMGVLNQRLEYEPGVTLAIRVGIHTGLVVVGEMGGEGRQEQLALGETPNIAARIQGLVAPDTVVISRATYQLAQGYFECQALEEHMLRGVAEPMVVYRVLCESGAQSRLDVATTRGLTPLVGRESEVTLLLDRWEQAQTGQGQVVLLSGEAGIGKSRLVQALKDRVADGPHTRLECRSSPYYQNTALYPIIDLSERGAGFRRDDPPQVKLDKLEHALSHYQLSLEETVPLFAALLSVPIPENRYPFLDLSPQQQRQKTLETMVTMLLELAGRQPLLFIVEDLHWSDPTTLEFLDLLLSQTPTAALFTLLTCRPEFQSTWAQRSSLTGVALNRLTNSQIEQMIHRLTEGKLLPADVCQQIIEKTDGVPLFVEEMTKSLLESGHLKAADGAYELTGPLPPLAIPTTLQDTLTARLDRLVTAKGIAQMGATIGREFTYELLQAIAPVNEAVLQRELGLLIDAELIHQRGQPPQATYQFKHALIQDAAYQSLLKASRQQYHQLIAQELTARFPDTVETQPELLAYHAFRGEMWDNAMTYFRQAGEKALARSAHRESVGHFEQALSTIPHLPEEHATYEQAIGLRLALRNALLPLGEFERISDILHEAETLAEYLDDRSRQAQIVMTIANSFWWTGEPDRGVEASERAIRLASACGDAKVEAVASFIQGLSYHELGAYERAIGLYKKAMTFFTGDRLYEKGGVPVASVVSRGMLTWSHAERGDYAEGIRRGEEGVRIAEASGHQGSLMRVCFQLGLLYLRKGELPQAIALLERSTSLSQVAEELLWFPLITSHLGYAYALSGRLPEALPLLENATERAAAERYMAYQALEVVYLSEGYLHAGRIEEASTQALRALDLSEALKARGDRGWVLRLLGDIAMHRDPSDVDSAKTHYEQALTLANELGMRPLQAHCHRGLGTLYSQVGQAEQAHTELSTAIEMYRDMEMTLWLPQAEAALAEMEKQ